MRGLIGTTLLVGGLCALAACGQTGGGGNAASNGASGSAGGGQASAGGGPAAPPAVAGGGDQTIDLSAMPHPRGGLWRVTEDDGDGHPTTDNHCYSGRVPVVKKPPTCTQFTLKRTLTGGFAMDMSCGGEGYTMVAHSEMSGDFQSHMTGDMNMTMTMQGQPPRTIHQHSDMQYVGDCAPGQVPDDAPDTNSAG
jgi:hypothetical protein